MHGRVARAPLLAVPFGAAQVEAPAIPVAENDVALHAVGDRPAAIEGLAFVDMVGRGNRGRQCQPANRERLASKFRESTKDRIHHRTSLLMVFAIVYTKAILSIAGTISTVTLKTFISDKILSWQTP